MNNIIEWRPIRGYDGFYEISTRGTVRGKERDIPLPKGKLRKIPAKILAPKTNADGYLFVTLSKGGVGKTKYIHRAVAEVFLDNPDNLPEVNHLSGVKSDNTLDNLEWCTHQQNVQHCYDAGICKN